MIPLFYPYIPEEAIEGVVDTLKSRWIGQAHKVDEFEKRFEEYFNVSNSVFLNSGTSALETAYDLIGLSMGDEVITTPMTCSATNLPLLARGVKIVWADVEPNMTISRNDVLRKLTDRTKAIVQIHLGGIKADVGEVPVPVVSDACQGLGFFNGDYVCNSFQAIKHITTADGGMITCPDKQKAREARLLRWFGIDRQKKIEENWQCYKNRKMIFDIEILGYKRQPTDIAAAMGLAGLKKLDYVYAYRKKLFDIYKTRLKNIPDIKLIDSEDNVHWLCTVLVNNRDDFTKKMFEAGVDVNLVHLRNDNYRIFGGRADLPQLENIEKKYICLPLNMKVTTEDVEYICDKIKEGW